MNVIDTKRKSLGIKVYELAQTIGIDPSLMSRILSGKRNPTSDQVNKLSKALELNFNEVMKEVLEEEIVNRLSTYPEMAGEVLQVAEERISYLSGSSKFSVITSEATTNKLEEIDELKAEWESKKPLNATQLRKMDEHFQTSYTFESNRIEGNTLTLKETHLVINEGITIGGKSVREHLEAINHKEAIALIIDLGTNKLEFNEFVLKQIHQLVLKGIDSRNAGVYRSVPVRITGSEHVPPEPYRISEMMEDYFRFYNCKKGLLHPVILAAEMHERLVSIHPFIDGNGRTSRLVMNLILLQHGFTIVNLKGDLKDKLRYYKALEAIQINHENEDFHALITEHANTSLAEHVHLAG